jgi:hypothetical protein
LSPISKAKHRSGKQFLIILACLVFTPTNQLGFKKTGAGGMGGVEIVSKTIECGENCACNKHE